MGASVVVGGVRWLQVLTGGGYTVAMARVHCGKWGWLCD